MKKSQINQLHHWSAEYVVAHAARKFKRGKGKNPSMPYRGIRNPRKALALAKEMAKDIENFRKNDSDFCWKNEEYEIFCCEQAIVIYNAMRTKLQKELEESNLTVEEYSEKHPMKVRLFFDDLRRNVPFEEKRKAIPELDTQINIHTFGTAMILAFLYIFHPENIAEFPKAISPFG